MTKNTQIKNVVYVFFLHETATFHIVIATNDKIN